MALPKRAASALTAAAKSRPAPTRPTPRSPRREEVHEVERPHVRDGGPVEPDREEEEPQAEGDEGGEQGAGGGAVLHGCCSWRRLLGGRCQSGHRAYRVADLHTSSAPTLALFFVRLLREGQHGLRQTVTHQQTWKEVQRDSHARPLPIPRGGLRRDGPGGLSPCRGDLIMFEGFGSGEFFGDNNPGNGLEVAISDGFAFAGGNDHFHIGDNLPGQPSNGTGILLEDQNSAITMTQVGGGMLDLLSADLAQDNGNATRPPGSSSWDSSAEAARSARSWPFPPPRTRGSSTPRS